LHRRIQSCTCLGGRARRRAVIPRFSARAERCAPLCDALQKGDDEQAMGPRRLKLHEKLGHPTKCVLQAHPARRISDDKPTYPP
jgi:hypothetical protein